MSGEELPVVRMSVRAVVEFTLHERDLSASFGAAMRMREGAAAHRARQAGYADADLLAEVPLCALYRTQSLVLRVTGRADGIREGERPVIEEIKLGETDSALLPAHEAQAEMYGHMLCTAEGHESVLLRVVYVGGDGKPLRVYERVRTAQALEQTFVRLCAAAAVWEEEKLARRRARDASLRALPFPYERYRAGQKRFAANVYAAIRQRKRLFAQAPTGIGKTVAALYPALRALGDGLCARVLYLTARTTGRLSALDALRRLAGGDILAVELTAKDKICPQPVRDCRPDVCPFSKGYFDRLPCALSEALCSDKMLDAAHVRALAMRHELCPFELSLALTQLADVVICDYNYVFDPFVAVDALLPGAALLVDEAHQLPPRVRDARSASVDEREIRDLRRAIAGAHGRKAQLYRALTGVLHALREAAQSPEFASGRLAAPPKALDAAMEAVFEAAGAQLAQGGSPAAADAWTLAAGYSFAASRLDEHYAVLTGAGRIRLLCLDAADDILETTRRARGTVFFSATLAPLDAAKRMLGSEEGDACLSLPSPFAPSQLCVQVEPIDLRYAARSANAPRVAACIARFLAAHAGHALVFFPSYAYRDLVAAQLETVPDVQWLYEQRGMDEAGRLALLEAFARPSDAPRAALLAVLGGAFSEGIDLPGARLTNVVIVSTGLPQPDERTRALQAYHEAMGEDGFFLTMTLPGMVRVVQAAGRLIRTEQDRGALLLVDARFCRRRERALLDGTLIDLALRAQEGGGEEP